MARARLTDYLQVNRYHLMDVSFAGFPPVFIPIFGFRSITLPTQILNWKQIKEGNYEFKRYVGVESAEVASITLEQGVSLLNSDFYDWIKKGVTGSKSARDLLLIQFTNYNPVNPKTAVGRALGSFTQAASAVSTLGGAIPGASLGGFGFFDQGIRLPGRAWLLKQCRPSNYKPGSDFDAMSSEVSLATLEILCEEFEEFSMGI